MSATQRTVITGFSGGGLADVGYRLAGYESIGAVEYDPQIAEVYRANLGDHIHVESIMDTDWRTFDRPDLLHMSPECKEFSQAKSGGKEGPIQRAQADAICRALETLTPPAFVLENVVGYRRSDYSLPVILRTLERLGYCYDLANINSADFGVAQTRRRLILRAVRGGLVPHLPAPVRWVGWYAAIEDLLPTLPESAFAPWQLARMEPLRTSSLVNGQNDGQGRGRGYRTLGEPALTLQASDECRTRAFLVSDQRSNDGIGVGVRDGGTPSLTVDTRAAAKTRAFIVHPTDQRSMPVRAADEPVWTMIANSYGDSHAPGPRPRAWLSQGRVVAMTPRALARFQSVPDSYVLPEARGLACKVVGNGCAVKQMQAIGESLMGVL